MLDISRPFPIPGTDVPLFVQVDADPPAVRQIATEPHMAVVAEFVRWLHRDMQELALDAETVRNRSEFHGLMWTPNLWGQNTLYAFIGRRVTLDPFMHGEEFAQDVAPIV